MSTDAATTKKNGKKKKARRAKKTTAERTAARTRGETEPEQVAAAPEQAAAEPEQVAAEPEQIAAEPEQIASEPEQVAAEPEQVTAEPEQIAAEPEQIAAEPEQIAAEPEEATAEVEETVADLLPVVEAVVFASNKPLPLQQLRRLTGASLPKLKETVEALQAKFDGGIELVEISGGYQFRTRADQANWVRKLVAGKPPRLTRAMLETLAIVAYRQPVTRPEVDEIRGVDCGGTLRVLLERNLLRILGKKEEVGRPLLYGTTKYFLEFFQLKDLKGLPTLRAFAELSEEHRQQVDERFAPEETAQPSTDASADQEAAAPQSEDGDQAGDQPSTDLFDVAAQEDASKEDEELMSVLDRALERANTVLKRPSDEQKSSEAASPSEEPPEATTAAPDAAPLADPATPAQSSNSPSQPGDAT